MHQARRRPIGLAIVAAGITFLATCRYPVESRESDTSKTTLRVGVRQLPSGPNEGLRGLAQTLSVESLARLGDDGRPQPQLARDWALSADGLALTVNLLPGVKFHDGSPLTATIVAEALKSALPNSMGPAFEDIDTVTPSTESQVVIRLRRPSHFLLDALETPVSKPGSDLVGTGPFIVAADRSPTELRANADYYRGQPAINRISVVTFPSVRAAWAEMLRGRLDMLYEVGLDALDSLEASNQISIFTYTRRYQYVLVLNTDAGVLRSKDVRQALNMAIDRDSLVRDALNGHGTPSSGPIWPRNYGLPPKLPALRFDPRVAAGMARTSGNANRAGNLHFTCFVSPDAVNERVALVLKRQLENVGADMTIEQASMDRIIGSVREHRFEAALMEMVSGPTLLRPYRLWHSGSGNRANSPAIDLALDSIRHAVSDREYSSGIGAFQQAMLDDPPAIFLAWMERARAVTKQFSVPAYEPGRDILGSLRLWKPATGDALASHN
jgi:peptide/nickel transport system substrate-binding protein